MNDLDVTALEERIHILEAENAKQKETIQWMHDLIWELIFKTTDITPPDN